MRLRMDEQPVERRWRAETVDRKRELSFMHVGVGNVVEGAFFGAPFSFGEERHQDEGEDGCASPDTVLLQTRLS